MVRRALNIPYDVATRLPEGSTEERAKAAVDWFMDMVSKQEKTWLAAITPEGIGRDLEVERILDDADRHAADRVLQAMGFTHDDPRWEQFNAVIRAYGGMVKVAGREWLVRGTLDRAQVHTLLSHVLQSLVDDVLPELATT